MRLPWRSVAALMLPAALVYAADPDCSAGNPDKATYHVTILAGTGDHYFYPTGNKFGTYKAVKPEAGCRWRLLVPIPSRPGKFFQTSPTKAGKWNTGHRVKIKKVTDPKYLNQPRVLETHNCGQWQRKVKVK